MFSSAWEINYRLLSYLLFKYLKFIGKIVIFISV
jgi:hypothetical protein